MCSLQKECVFTVHLSSASAQQDNQRHTHRTPLGIKGMSLFMQHVP